MRVVLAALMLLFFSCDFAKTKRKRTIPRAKDKNKKKSYYELLGVEQASSEKEIKKAYRKIALEQHPDKAKSKEDKELRQKLFVRLAHVYEILSDIVTRTRCDSLLKVGQVEYEDRNWELFDAAHGTQRLSRRAQLVFQPSPLGFTFIGNIIDKVVRDSQAGNQGVREGWCIVEVNGESQSKNADAIQQAIDKSHRAGQPTVIIFEKRKKPKSWEDANDILKTTEEKEKSEFMAVVISFSLAGFVACIPAYRAWKKKQKKAAMKELSSEQKELMKEEQQIKELMRRELKEQQEIQKADDREYQRRRREALAALSSDEDEGDTENEKEEIEIFKCELCKKNFKSEKQFSNHQNSKMHKKKI